MFFDSLALWEFFHAYFSSSADLFQTYSKSLFKYTIRVSIWIQIRPHILSGLIWFQTVCKSYQQTTLVGNELIWTARFWYLSGHQAIKAQASEQMHRLISALAAAYTMYGCR